MTARIGRAYPRSEQGRTANQAAAAEHFFSNRRARLRERLGTAFLVLAWAAAILGLMATFWSIL